MVLRERERERREEGGDCPTGFLIGENFESCDFFGFRKVNRQPVYRHEQFINTTVLSTRQFNRGVFFTDNSILSIRPFYRSFFYFLKVSFSRIKLTTFAVAWVN
jgi:hypothetical protein